MTLNLPAIGTIGDASKLRVVLYQSGQLIHGPYGLTSLGVSTFMQTVLDDENADAAVNTLLSGTQGDILYRGASAWQKLTLGTEGQILEAGPSAPRWIDKPAKGASALEFGVVPGTTISSSSTVYLGPTGHSTLVDVHVTSAPADGTLKNLRTRASGSLNDTCFYTVRVNGANTSIQVGTTSSQDSDLVNTVSVSAGDRVQVKFQSGSSATAREHFASVAFVPD